MKKTLIFLFIIAALSLTLFVVSCNNQESVNEEENVVDTTESVVDSLFVGKLESQDTTDKK